MLDSHPPRSPGYPIGITLIVCLLALDAGLLILLLDEPLSWLTILWALLLIASAPALIITAYWTSSLRAARYHIEEGRLLIDWGPVRHTLPLTHIRQLLPAEAPARARAFWGFRWPGHYVGVSPAASPDDPARPTLYFATRPPAEQLLVVTDDISYAISPFDRDNFQDCLAALQATFAVEESGRPPVVSSFLGWRVWSDGLAWLVGLAAPFLNILLFGYLAALYSRLPAEVPLHFSRAGQVDRTGSPAGLLVVPLAGLIAWLLIGALGWLFYQARGERPVALILWGSATVVQLAAWYVIAGLLAQIV
jgi:hypothetical protein